MSRNSGTITLDGHPYRDELREIRGPVPELCIVWSLDEPERIGETAPLGTPVELGRGADGSGAPRAAWYQHRGQELLARPALQSRRISRVQLLVEPRPEGVFVRQLGRTALVVNGREVTEALVLHGRCFGLRGAVSFLVDARPSEPGPPALATFPFGAPDEDGIVGESLATWRLREQLALTAVGSRPVLILGESGTGKELVARALHRRAARGSGPFVARNAATLPDGLADAELFGSARGFPHAGAPERAGLIGEAENGTLFLDEIGELPLALQAHLLRLLDDGAEYQRLGDARTRRSNARVVAATNRPVAELKHDLAARFALRVTVSPLHARRGDIPLLVQHLLARLEGSLPAVARFAFVGPTGQRHYRVTAELVESAVERAYRTHSRELEQLLLEAITHSPRDFLDLPPGEPKSPPAAPEPEDAAENSQEPSSGELRRFDEVSKADLEQALGSAEGNVTRAAALLSLKNRYVLLRLMKKFGLSRDA